MWRNDTKCKYMFMFPLKNLVRYISLVVHLTIVRISIKVCDTQVYIDKRSDRFQVKIYPDLASKFVLLSLILAQSNAGIKIMK